MAMLGVKADMQCGYLPGHYSTRDYLNAGCSIWPFSNTDSIPKNGHYSSGSFVSSPPDQHLGYKEILKQTILRHEAIFKDQIHELHRLYNRQKELMAETKRNQSHGHHLQLETLQSNPFLSQNSSEYSKQTCQVSALLWSNHVCNQPSSSGAENNALHWGYVQEKAAQLCCDPVQTEGYIKESELLKSKCKKIGKKILDLELPADVYIDSEDDESLARDKIQSSDLPNYSLKIISEHIQESDAEPPLSRGDDNLVCQEHYMPQTSCSRKFKDLADLNEPVKLDEEIDKESIDFPEAVPRYREIPCKGLAGKGDADFQAQLNEIINSNSDEAGHRSSDLNSRPEDICVEMLYATSEGTEIERARENQSRRKPRSKRKKGLESSEKDFSSDSCSEQDTAACEHTPKQLAHLADVMNYESTSNTHWRKHEVMRAPMVVQALSCFNTSGSTGIAGYRPGCGKNPKVEPKLYSASPQSSVCIKTTRNIDLNSLSPSCSPNMAVQSVWMIDGGNEVVVSNSGEKPTANVAAAYKCDKKFSGFGFHIDLNTCLNEEESSPLILLSGFQAPESPENKESSPPRGESDENQVETPLPGIEEIVQIAAETIVSISSSKGQTFAENASFKPSNASKIQSLDWFARIVSSVVDDPKSQFGVALSYKDIDVDVNDGYLFDGIDYFEAMTLKLKETEVEDYCCNVNIQKEDAAYARSAASEPRRHRTRRGRQQRKDFQSEILPSLASLSRYEVTEDLQAIGGLIEAARNGWNSSAKKASRNGCTKERRRQPSDLSKLKSKCNNLSIEEISLIGWGKITRGRRSMRQRCPASNLPLISGQV